MRDDRRRGLVGVQIPHDIDASIPLRPVRRRFARYQQILSGLSVVEDLCGERVDESGEDLYLRRTRKLDRLLPRLLSVKSADGLDLGCDWSRQSLWRRGMFRTGTPY
jgi:hypothetical protein